MDAERVSWLTVFDNIMEILTIYTWPILFSNHYQRASIFMCPKTTRTDMLFFSVSDVYYNSLNPRMRIYIISMVYLSLILCDLLFFL